MTLAGLDAAPPTLIAALAGLDPTPNAIRGGGLYVAPGPCCGALRAHTRGGKDRRGPVHVRGGWHCYACGASGSRADLIGLARHGRRWAELSVTERAQALDAPPPETTWTAPPPPPRMSGEDWARLVSMCVSVRCDPMELRRDARRRLEAALAWFERRRLPRAPDLLVIVDPPDEGVSYLWTEGGVWLPDLGASLVLPCYDETGTPRGARLRNVRPSPRIKEQAIRGFSASGLAYLPRRLRERIQRGEAIDRPVVLAEGKPDQIALAPAWGRVSYVVGYYEGSLLGAWTAPLLGAPWIHVHQEDAPDKLGKRKSDHYRELVRAIKPDVEECGVSRLYGRAGVEWRAGMDVADLAGRVPPFEP